MRALHPGSVSELINDLEGAIFAYEQALRHNAYCIPAMNQISAIHRTKENFPKAVEYLQAILKIEGNNGEVWSSLGRWRPHQVERRRAHGRLTRKNVQVIAS